MLKNIKASYTIFWQLLKIDLYVLFKDIKSTVLDTSVWITLSTFCNGYIFPHLGVGSSYGAFLVIGHLVSNGFFMCFYAGISIAGDINGDKVVGYELTLPLPAWMVFLKKALAWCAKALVVSILILPLAKVILMSRLDFSQFSILKFLLSFGLVNLFCSFMSIFTASIVDDLLSTGRVWVRYIYPFWYLGGTIFPFKVVYQSFPWLGMVLLLNPVTYATELIRASILGVDSYLIPFWISAAILSLFSLLLFLFGFFRLKCKLDFI